MNPRLLTVQDVCEQLQVGKQLIYNAIRSGDLRRIKVGNEFRFRQEDVDDYLERHTQ